MLSVIPVSLVILLACLLIAQLPVFTSDLYGMEALYHSIFVKGNTGARMTDKLHTLHTIT